MADSGVVTLAALVSPYRSDRDNVRRIVEEHENDGRSGDNSIPFIEIYVNASLQTCESRDPKGLYKMAREGKIKNFTGIDDPYEEPTSPELILDSNTKSIEELAEETCSYILDKIKL
jgi:adenylylsulfate kinase